MIRKKLLSYVIYWNWKQQKLWSLKTYTLSLILIFLVQKFSFMTVLALMTTRWKQKIFESELTFIEILVQV